MRIDAVGLPVDRLQLRSESVRPSVQPTFSPPAPVPTVRSPLRSGTTHLAALTPLGGGQGAAAAGAAAAAALSMAESAATPATLIHQLRRQRLSLGRMLGEINRQLSEQASRPVS